jgi:hypothetical protein
LIILDTNVLSELMQGAPEPSVVEWLDQQPAERQRNGRTVDMRDTQIAGIVIARRATLATRNVKHFADLTAEVVNPWEAKR